MTYQIASQITDRKGKQYIRHAAIKASLRVHIAEAWQMINDAAGDMPVCEAETA